ncbi:hypothetical protein D6777_03350, partial [Candidatus Woesearchaeota archaeon]
HYTDKYNDAKCVGLRELNQEMIKNADEIYALEKNHEQAILELMPNANVKTLGLNHSYFMIPGKLDKFIKQNML